MLLSNDTIIMTFDLYQNIRNAARMTLYYASEIFFLKKTADFETDLHSSRNFG